MSDLMYIKLALSSEYITVDEAEQLLFELETRDGGY